MASSLDAPTLPAPPAIEPSQPVARHASLAWRQFARSLRRRPLPRPAADLHAAQQAFTGALADLSAADARALCQLLAHARSFVELWHLRPEVFRVLALHHSQAEAERRVAALNPLFAPQRPPR